MTYNFLLSLALYIYSSITIYRSEPIDSDSFVDDSVNQLAYRTVDIAMKQQMGLKNQDDEIREEEWNIGKEIAGVRRGITRPPLNFRAILNDAGISTLDASSPDHICRQLYAGVYLKPNKLMYFVDEKSNKNCFVVFARELYVCHGDNPECWQWIQQKETSGEYIEVVELVEVWWLDIRGNIRTIDLSPGTLYEIIFIVRIKPESVASTSKLTVNLIINPQHSKSLTRSESLAGKPLENWFEIQVGEFMMSPQYVGNMEFCLQQHHGECKEGLLVKCAIIRPKK